MKEGSFDSQLSGLDFNDPDVKKVKTPDQVPNRIDLSSVPESVLRSTVIESLIQQNDDLMARLTVTLRRVAVLEEKVHDAHTKSAQYREKYENLKDQVLILREQGRILSERTRTEEQKKHRDHQSVAELREQIRVLEIRYAELYASAQAKEEILTRNFDGAQRQVSRYRKYREHMRRVLNKFRTEYHIIKERIGQQEATIQDLRKNLTETTSYISEQARNNKAEVTRLVEAYETDLRAQKSENDMLVEQNRTLGARAQEVERLFYENVKLENDLIIARRKDEEIRIQHAAEVSDIQKSLVRYRNESKELALQAEQASKDLEASVQTNEQVVTEKKGLLEQVETLQLLWRDQQYQIEKVTGQNSSLQKLNQEMSYAINEYRREIRDLKEKLSTVELKYQDAVAQHDKTRDAQAAALKQILKEAEEPAIPTPSVTREDLISPELITKIDKAISTIHTGL